MSRARSTLLTVVLLLTLTAAAHCQPWPRVEQPAQGVTILYDDFGDWGGGSMGTSHQVNPSYQVRKTIDLSGLSEGVLAAGKEGRLRVFFACQDYSWALPNIEWNGLDESFELHVNGHVHAYRTAEVSHARAGKEDKMAWQWYDFIIPREELVAGKNLFLFSKAASDKPRNDDYIYVGIDNTESHGNSEMSDDGGATWRSEKLNAIDATGEYMVRLVLIATELSASATWRPGVSDGLDDPTGLVGYAEVSREEVTENGARLTPGAAAMLEFDVHVIDGVKPVSAEVQFAGAAPTLSWASRDGDALEAETTVADGKLTSTVPAKLDRPAQLTLAAPEQGETEVRLVTINFSRPYLETEPVVDMAPRISQPKGGPVRLASECQVLPGEAIIRDSLLACHLETSPRLRMTSLVSRWVDRDILLAPERTRLFLVETGEQRFGAEDCRVRSVTKLAGKQGLVADLLLEEYRLAARLTIALAEVGQLRLGLELTNEGDEPLDFKLAFPHLAGLALSEDWREDYYLFPFFGGIIADVSTYLRTAYGENSAWWQMIDLFSPGSGGGLSLRCLDETGLYKCPVLRKGETSVPGYSITTIGHYMEPEMWWEQSLDPGLGTAMTFEYIRRTRAPGESFSPPDAMISMHKGDWRVPLAEYSEWAHTVWQWRPHPSKLKDCWNITATGWGQSPLFKDGAYRTDFIQEGRDVLEMMSWWEWSELGPWHVPMDQVEEKLGTAFYNRYKHYWVPEPTTGELMYPLNRGDYKYNERWGGLPALRQYIQLQREAGILPMFYMEGILACETTEVGHNYGPKYGVKNPLWTDHYKTGMTPEVYVGSYGSYNMCSDTEWWQDYLARTVKRVCADTGIGGVRLDEYGHRGYICHSTEHEHMFAAPGHNAWLQAVSEACRKVHAGMDEVSPDLVLTTEFPGYDHLARYLEGCIVYECMSHVRPVRPVPCNLFRFYFPECKVYDLERGTAHAEEWKLWNAMGAFGRSHPPRYYRILKENADLFEMGAREALIPTLVQRVYANRFTSEAKQITLLYNARGHTVEGPLVAVEPKERHHFFELLRCQELTPTQTGEGHAVGVKLRRDQVACIARLPKLLTVVREADAVAVQVAGQTEGMSVALVAADGQRLLEVPAASGVTLRFAESTEGPVPACVKLMAEKYLVDATALPPS